MGLAVHNFHDARNELPGSRYYQNPGNGATWAVLLLPYLEEEAFFEQWDLTQSFYNHAQGVREQSVSAYICPSRGRVCDQCM